MHEFILVLRKGNVKSGRTQRDETLPATHEEWTKEIANSVWHIAPVPPGYITHPCPFPEEIPYRLMKLYSYEGDTVLDPFNEQRLDHKGGIALQSTVHRNRNSERIHTTSNRETCGGTTAYKI